MHAGHWQLRSFLNAPKRDHVHYLGGRDIYRINTSTNIREIIDTVTFEPRCLVSGNGFVCCGGNTGEFSVVRLCQDVERSEISRLISSYKLARTGTIPLLKSGPMSFGKEIVNCITLWFPNEGTGDFYSRPLAVLASNDKSIYIVDLEELTTLQTIKHAEAVNLGVISPDGTLLIVVGDDPYMRVYKREPVQTSYLSGSTMTWKWVKFSEIILPGQKKEDDNEMKGSFTGSFTHKLFAVGTQYGTVAIFEQHDLHTWRDALPIAVFDSSRPNTRAGAIRSLQFNPSSFLELLAITEDDGRVNVVDVRQFFKRQVLNVSPGPPSKEVKLEFTVGPSYTEPNLRAEADTTDDEPDLHHNALERQDRTDRTQAGVDEALQRSVDAFWDDQHLTLEETRVLQALQNQRRRREENLLHSEPVEGDPELSADPDSMRGITRTPSAIAQARSDARAARLENERRTVERLDREMQNIRQELREREVGRERDASWVSRAAREEARRTRHALDQALSSHIARRVEREAGLDASGRPSDPLTAHIIRRAERELGLDATPRLGLPGEPRLVRSRTPPDQVSHREPLSRRERALRHARIHPPRISAGQEETDNANNDPVTTSLGIYLNNSGWAEMQTLAGLANELPPDTETHQVGRINLRRNIARAAAEQMDHRATMRRQQNIGWMPSSEMGMHWSRARGVLAGHGATTQNSTTGCSWSPDGQILYVGTEGGVYEFHVNITSRKFAPSLQLA